MSGDNRDPRGPVLPEWGTGALVATVDVKAYQGRVVPVLDLEHRDHSAKAKTAAPGIVGSPPSVWGVWGCQYQWLDCQKDQASQALP